MAPLKSETQRVTALNPGNAIREDQSVWDGDICITTTDSIVSNVEGTAKKLHHWEIPPAGA